MDGDIIQQRPGALSPESYASYEVAKSSDGIIGGNEVERSAERTVRYVLDHPELESKEAE